MGSEGEEGAGWDVVTWDPEEQEGEGEHMEGVGVGSVPPQPGCVFAKGGLCVARCPTANTYCVNAPTRDQLCGRMERAITIQTPILAYTYHSACLSCTGEC